MHQESQRAEQQQERKVLSSRATKEEHSMVKGLKSWEMKNFKKIQHDMFKEYTRGSSPSKLARVATIQNNLTDIHMKQRFSSQFMSLEQISHTVTLQQDHEQELCQLLEDYETEHAKFLAKDPRQQSHGAVTRMNKGVLKRLDRVIRKQENILLKQT